jgi:hypothetical protein
MVFGEVSLVAEGFTQDGMILSVRKMNDMPAPECHVACGMPYGVQIAVWDSSESSQPKLVNVIVFGSNTAKPNLAA